MMAGHVGVGSIIGLNNARVAKELGLDMILVSNGGLGSAFDQLELNRQVWKDGLMIDGCIGEWMDGCELGLDMILVSNGGLGSAFDQLTDGFVI